MTYKRINCSEFCRRLMRRRPMSEDAKLDTPLKRCLNAPQLTLYCIAHMTGAGLYVLTGQLIRDFAGPATAIAYFVSAFISIFTAMCYAEFATLFPRAGSAYLYTYLMFGELPAFIIGWTMISDMVVATATISKAFSGTINWLSNGTVRAWVGENLGSFEESTVLDSSPDIIAAGFIIILMIATVFGANISLTINAVLSSLQVLSLIVLIVSCFVFGSEKNYVNEGGFLPFGVSGLLRGAGLAVFGFSGFEAVANASEETQNPKRDLPLALFASLFICAVLYVCASLGLAFLIPRSAIQYDCPFVAAFTYIGQPGLMGFAAFTTLLATGATKLVSMYVIPRMFYSLASDGLIFGFMAHVASRTGVPVWSLLVGGCITILLALLIKIQVLAEFTSIGLIFCYFVIGLDLMILRYFFQNEYHVIKDYSVEDTDESTWLSTTAVPINQCSLFLPVSDIWLRKRVPSCLRHFENKRCFEALLICFIAGIFFLGIALNAVLIHPIGGLWIVLGISGGVVIVTFLGLCLYEPMRFSSGFEKQVISRITPYRNVLIGYFCKHEHQNPV
ncbi:unnamed protein product [Calicophoron daubneyi]|uniref:Uncharacterized protein n=1 Tax=Calicophoron daubneyi TaxID=300641 RepID=A0AAV2TQM0_CALDB